MKSLIFFLITVISVLAQSSEDKKIVLSPESDQPSFSPFGINLSSPAQTIDFFSRTKYIIEQYLKIAPEPSYQNDVARLSGIQSLAGFKKIYSYFDKEKQLTRFSAFDSTGAGTLHVYQDRDVRQTDDYDIPFALNANNSNPFASFRPTPDQPLAGLRIALDPGHMGGKIWDQRTGKFVTDHQGHTLSEGVINLQTCLLLKSRLEKAGATVLITHENIGPVTDKTWEGLNLKNYIPREIYSDTLEPWWISLIEEAPVGKALNEVVAKSPNIKRIFSEDMRYEFFILKEDIDARAKKIKVFNADVTLIIHYDTSDPQNDINGVSKTRIDYTKVYVPGAFDPTEFSSREFRKDFAKHIFNPFWWNASVSLAKALSLQLRTTLQLKGDKPYGEQVGVADGVISRNLSLTRQIDTSAIAYVECLYYNDPVEFIALLKNENFMTIGGLNYPYSNRLKQVVDSLESGVLNFAANVNAL
jgi:N-acetylmuramoyl-L-alanine amidase